MARRGREAFGLCAALQISSAALAQWPCTYEVVVLKGPTCPNGNTAITEQALNEAGQVAGGWGCGFNEGFPWIGAGGDNGTVLPLPPGAFAAGARAINNNMTNSASNGELFGEVAGIAFVPEHRAFRYSGDSHTLLPMIPGATASFAEGINDTPIVVGYTGNYVTWDPPDCACIWTRSGIQNIVQPGRAFDINDHGAVTGVAGAVISGKAFIWHNEKLELLPAITGGTTSQGSAINNHSHIAGVGTLIPPGESSAVLRSFLWRDNKMIMLDILPGFKNMRAKDINDHDEIVGYLQPIIGQSSPFLWRNGLTISLKQLVDPAYNISSTEAINNDGIILARAVGVSGVLLKPIYGPPGDLNCDGVVNVADLLILLQNWGGDPTSNLEAARCDLNEDGSIGVPDLLILLANWG